MKQYMIDELRRDDYEKIRTYLSEHFEPSDIDGIYWVVIDRSLLSDTQKDHKECAPFYFAIELNTSKIACELLVRTKNRIRCNCINYATEHQRNWLIKLVDGMLEELGIIA